MSETLKKVLLLVRNGEVKISEHGYDELASDDLFTEEIVSGVEDARVVEDYPLYAKGPCVLVLQLDHQKNPVHVLWGIPRGQDTPAVVVTAYRPDPLRWTEDFMRRVR